MFVRKAILTIFFFFILFFLPAHEFWLHPNKFIYKKGETINLKLLIGENYEGENWSGSQSRIETFKLYFADVTDDLSEHISADKGDSLQIALFEEGTAMIVFHSSGLFSELESSKFNKYLGDDLRRAFRYRREDNQTDSSVIEVYQRNVKTLIQVGKATNNLCTQTTGLPLDIIPLTNPYDIKKKDSIRIKVLFKEKPFDNALINVWHRAKKKTIKSEYSTDENGEVMFPVEQSGRWMVSTVNMVRMDDNPKGDWQSYWGSLTWGYIK